MIIEISDLSPDRTLVPTLRDILFLLPISRQELVWAILEMEVVGKKGSNILAIEEKINNNPIGLILDWQQLVDLTELFFQEINIIVVACSDERLLPRLGRGEEYYSSCEIVIEGVDTTFWSVYARDAQDVEQLRKSYKNVVVVKD